ncbi:MAG: patatin-like phospholipase family protein [Proteobacteria bacterium]|nr:patatin-like phospholipase family protein [Pseudomonadota bacterium]
MADGGTGVGRTALRFVAIFAILLIAAGSGGFAFWLHATGEPPPPLAISPIEGDIATIGASSVTYVPGIGPRTYGDCTRILSLDGGGVRGLVPALILAEIERRTGQPISRSFDLIVGTSTGSILALGLTRPSNVDAHKPALSADDLVKLYRGQAGRIFPSSLGPFRNLRRIFRPKFDPSDVEVLFRSYFEDVRLQEALTNVAVPAYDIEANNRVWFVSWGGQGRFYMRDIVRGATAAPTFFPPAHIAYRTPNKTIEYLSLVDGALFANNPSLDALAYGQVIRSDKPMLLVSIGTGRSTRKYTFNEAWGWGVLGWMDPLLDIAFSDPAIDGIVEKKLEGHGDYYRVQVDLGAPPIELDDSSPDALARLEARTRDFIAEHRDAIDGIVTQLTLPRATECGPTIGADYERPDGPRERDLKPAR